MPSAMRASFNSANIRGNWLNTSAGCPASMICSRSSAKTSSLPEEGEGEDGVRGCWSDGVLECWSDGVLECWSDGVVEWGIGVLGSLEPGLTVAPNTPS